MADLAAADVTVTVEEVRIHNRKRVNRCKITFGDGVKTYPAAGVPMPAFSSFGMLRALDYVQFIENDSSKGFNWKYDKVNSKMRGYWEVGGSGAAPVAADTDPTVAAGAVAVTSTAATAPLSPGRGKEFIGATTTIPATTLFVEAVGW